jgi:omega-amidase
MSADYHAWGHSTIVDPNGEVISSAGEMEEIVYADLSMFLRALRIHGIGPERMQEVRAAIPVTTQRRYA